MRLNKVYVRTFERTIILWQQFLLKSEKVRRKAVLYI